MLRKKMGYGKVTFDFLFEKRIHSNTRIFLEIFRNVFQWDAFLLPGDSGVPLEPTFSCLMQGTSSISQGAAQSFHASYLLYVFLCCCFDFLSGEII